MLSSDFYTQTRKQLIAKLPAGAVAVIPAHKQLQMSADLTYPFRQDSNFRYLAGADEPDAVLVLSKKEQFLIVNDRSDFTQLWDGQPTIEELSEATGLEEVLQQKEGWKKLKSILPDHKKVGILEPITRMPWGGEVNPARKMLKTRLKKQMKKSQDFVDLRPILAELRSVKHNEEIEALKQAIEVTAFGYSQLEAQLPNLTYEYEVEAVLGGSFKALGCNHAYEPIIGSGIRSCVLHYKENDQTIDENIILIDSAAEFAGYHADISRTLAHDGKFSKRQQKVYDAVLRVQEAAINNIRPGITYRESEKFIREKMADELVQLGLATKKDSLEATKEFYPHSGHYIGLDVHDAGDYDAKLKPGMTVTIEPGIYIPQEQIGVRIEDMILITEDGAENLSKSIRK